MTSNIAFDGWFDLFDWCWKEIILLQRWSRDKGLKIIPRQSQEIYKEIQPARWSCENEFINKSEGISREYAEKFHLGKWNLRFRLKWFEVRCYGDKTIDRSRSMAARSWIWSFSLYGVETIENLGSMVLKTFESSFSMVKRIGKLALDCKIYIYIYMKSLH